jgi:hypothetical protein
MNRFLKRAAAFTFALVATGCSADVATTAPIAAPAAASHDLLGGLLGTVGNLTNSLGLTSVRNLKRTIPLAAPITVVKTIGAEGGYLSIPAAGVTVVVPAGALSRPTDITMTARAGSVIAYDFEPHGITFARPLVFTQSLRGTNAPLLSLRSMRLGYYSDPSLLGETTSLVSELIKGLGSIFSSTFTAPINHFSGYLVTWGCTDDM